VILDEKARSFLNEKRMPHPSVVCYDGGQIIVGAKAKERIDGTDTAMNENMVRSPKVELAKDNIYINGREKDPVTVVADLMRHLKEHASADRASSDANLDRAVVSIPVAMDGRTRRKLRDALLQAGIHVVQFVHEPLAALYGYFKDQTDFQHVLSTYQGRLALVYDWGGGTLDLTLCRVINGAVTQVMNAGDNGVGGDFIDEAILAEVIKRHAKQENIPVGAPVEPGAKAKLLNACEKAKIELSSKEKVLVYVPDYYLGGEFDGDIECTLTREDLAKICEHYVNKGLSCIDRLLDKLNIDQRQISLCLATGGMVNMPMIRSRLEQIFSIDRLEISSKGDRIISEGCAWIAHDELQMALAKPIEIAEARGAFLPVFKSGTRLPIEGEAIHNQVNLYCVDPRDKKAKIKIVRPRDVGKAGATDERLPYDLLTVEVDGEAQAFLERIIIDLIIDDNFIVTVKSTSSLIGDSSSCEIFDLEFSLTLPDSAGGAGDFFPEGLEPVNSSPELGIVVSRENVIREHVDLNGQSKIMERQKAAVPGEYLYTYSSRSFDPQHGDATKIQDLEKLYYQPCSVCKKRFNDPNCQCG
jgi:actin-like ATPase involved in cell morphogenesis